MIKFLIYNLEFLMNFQFLMFENLRIIKLNENLKFKIGAEKGFGVIEVLVSLMVITSAVTAVILVVFSNQSLKLDNEVNNVTLYRAGEIIGKSQVLGVADFNSVMASSSTNDIFTESLSVSDISPCRKDIASSVDWSVQANRPQNISLTTSLVSQEEAEALGYDCEITPPADDWQIECPPQYGYDLNPAGLAASGIDLVKRGFSKYIIMSSNKGSVEKNDFWIIDVTDKTAIYLVSSIHTGPNLNDVDAFGNYAFVANNDSTDQLVVIDISDLSNPAAIAYASLVGVNPAGSFPEGREIFYYNNRVYVGTRETAGPEFHIFDVSDPANPVHLGSRELNHTIRQIIVRGNYAYLATSGNQNELVILDVSDPTSVQPVFPGVGNPEPWRYNAPGNQDGRSLYLLGNKIYLGRQRGTGANHDFLILNIANPASVTLLGSTILNLNPNTAVEGIIVSGNLAFTATSDQNAGFKILDITNPLNIVEIDSCNYFEKAVDVDFDGQYNYIANESNNALRIINSTTSP